MHKSSGDVDIYAKNIISSAGVINTFTKLIPPHVSSESSKLSLFLFLDVVDECGINQKVNTLHGGFRGLLLLEHLLFLEHCYTKRPLFYYACFTKFVW